MKQKSQFYFTSVSNIVIAEQEKKLLKMTKKIDIMNDVAEKSDIAIVSTQELC